MLFERPFEENSGSHIAEPSSWDCQFGPASCAMTEIPSLSGPTMVSSPNHLTPFALIPLSRSLSQSTAPASPARSNHRISQQSTPGQPGQPGHELYYRNWHTQTRKLARYKHRLLNLLAILVETSWISTAIIYSITNVAQAQNESTVR